MPMLEKVQETMNGFRKIWATRLALMIVPMLLLSVFASLVGGTGTASAASVAAAHSPLSISRQASAQPYTSGGGCYSNALIQSCISINSNNVVVPDAYSKAYVCHVSVVIYEDGYYVDNYYYSGCYSAGTHFYGPPERNGLFVTWQAKAIANGVGQLSPIQYS